jgi:ABC-type ATPase with predicted acetyltransferase domain
MYIWQCQNCCRIIITESSTLPTCADCQHDDVIIIAKERILRGDKKLFPKGTKVIKIKGI